MSPGLGGTTGPRAFRRRRRAVGLLSAGLLVAGLPAVGMLAGCESRRQAPSRPLVIKIGTVLPESHPTAAALKVFRERIEALSGGTMTAHLFFSSALGDADEVIELCRMGDVEMAQVSAANLSVYAPLANALAMPFIWSGPEHQFRALDGEVGRIIREHIAPLGLEVLGFFDAGTRNISTRKGPILAPADLAGMKIRVMNAPLMVAAIDALGGSAVAMNQGEVFTALQMGVIDGWENNPMTVATFRMYETGCIHFAWTRHFSIPDCLVAGRPFLGRLTDAQRGWVTQAAVDTVAAQRRMWRESEEKALEQMRAGGMQFNEVRAELFRQRVRGIYDEYARRYGEEFRALCDLIASLRDDAPATGEGS